MFVTTVKNVNRRSGAASTAAVCTGFIAVNQSVEIVSITGGDEIDGNSMWYKSAAGEYLWSGGFAPTNDLLLVDNKPIKLQDDVLSKVYETALHELTSGFYFDIPSCKGAGVGFKTDDPQPGLRLIIFTEDSNAGVAQSINFRGYAVLTDVKITEGIIAANGDVYCDNASPIQIGGGTLGENENPETTFGTRTAVVTSGGQQFILTCFHVACQSLLRQGIMKYSKGQTINVNIPSADSHSVIQKSGQVAEGILGDQYDYALVGIENTAWIVSRIADIGSYNGFYTLPELTWDKLKDLPVQQFGARTNNVSTGTIVAYKTDTVTIKYRVKTDSGPKIIEAGISGLIVSNAPSMEGDSGAPVVDQNKKLLGHVIAFDPATSLTYIMPFAYLNYYRSITLNQSL